MNDTPTLDAPVPLVPSGGHKDDNARERLLRAGAAEFLARGFPKARLMDIVRSAGVTTGPLYWHFQDKEGLFGALVADAYDAVIALQDAFLAYYRTLDDANKWREAIYGGRSFVGDLAVLLFDHRDEFRLLVDNRAVGTRWDGLPRLLAERELEAEWPWIDANQKNVPGGPIPQEALLDLLHGAYGTLFNAALRAKSREEVSSAAGKIHAFYVAGTCAVLDLAPDGSRK